MSGFKALNIESDDESDVEIDDTKELQIEDALKLYQTALKFHSEGPASFELAAKAYEELFQSDIFKYPESQTELRRIELYGPLSETEELWQNDTSRIAVATAPGADTGPSTLPQILHLSHKNCAQFKLEYLTARFETLNVTLSQILADAVAALDHFVEALDKDDSDLDLWRRTASVGGMLNSQRVARFCLEAVLDGDDESLGGVLSLPGLEEGLAGEQLRHLVSQFEDVLSLFQAPLSTTKRKMLSKMLKQRLASYESIDDRKKALEGQEGAPVPRQPQRVLLAAPETWAEMGQLLLQQLLTEQHGKASSDPAISIAFDLSSVVQAPLEAIENGIAVVQVDSAPKQLEEDSTTASGQVPVPEGQPMTQIETEAGESKKTVTAQSSAEEEVAMAESPTMTLPTRKRSGDAAGLNDSPEEGRTKSKRTRTRESTAGDEGKQTIMDANTRWELEQKLAELQAADDWMFETVGNLFERIGIVGFEAGKNVRQGLQSPTTGEAQAVEDGETSRDGLELARSDLQAFLHLYTDKLAHVLMVGGETLDVGQRSSASGFSATLSNGSSSKVVSKPLDMPDDGLLSLLENVNEKWLMTEEVAWLWLNELLRPTSEDESNTYLRYCWPEDLKTMVVRTLVNFDENITRTTLDELESLKRSSNPTTSSHPLAEMIETIFELHLDIFTLIKKPNSGVDVETIAAQSDRLQQWSAIAREAIHLRCLSDGIADLTDELNLRFLWATTFAVSADPGIEQAHVIECMNDLRANFVAAEAPALQLQNNAIMPELSLTALDRELTQLTTKDFFLKVTNQDDTDPVAIIESLEPLLAALMDSSSNPRPSATSEESTTAAVSSDLVHFLESSDLSVRLLLWQRLRDAYSAIEYKPMVVSCCFKMVGVLLNELRMGNTAAVSQADRQVAVLRTVRLINELLGKAFAVIQNSKDAFECIDEDGLKASVTFFGEVLQLLQVFNINEDSIRIGQSQAPTLPSGLAVASFESVSTMIHKMQVQIWIILYGLLKEAIFQFHDLFTNPADDMFEFLKVVHRNLGLRGTCGSSNRVFVRMLKDEFFRMTHVEGYESEQAQVLYDLYGLNCFLNPSYELMEHNCTHDAFLDRSVAVQAIDLLLLQASKLPMKDLIKHPIRDTIDKVHGAAPRKKPTDAIMRNREIQRAFLRSPINPLDLYSCLKGEGNQLNVSLIPKEDALLASKGWYFLMGHIALAKFRSQKRTGPTPTEDVDIAIAFFMQDLEFTSDNWETWFRLAQAYDTKIEESVVWSAEKLNNSMNEIVQLQRATIHCYTMATALAYRSADLSLETSEKMVELFHDFAMRLYSSSREPFAMLPFALDETEKFFSYEDRPIGTGKPFQPLRPYTVWKLAKVLFQRVLAVRSDSWTLHFTFGKCLWKMHTASDRVRGRHNIPPSVQEVLSSFIRAIELIPDKDKKDSREKREPVLEPHYKLVSIVHKLVLRQEITLPKAREALNNTTYARTATFPDELDEWVPHVLVILKNLRAADKSNWHHRMIARAAQIVYDDSDPRADADGPSQNLGAIGAKHELTQQMFTKTMVLQVWRPECERPGRHFVYTTRYTRFFVRLLEQLRDRANLEMLARRVRRRPHDLFEHALVWQDICYAYLRLLRSYANLAEGLETSTFSTIAHEDFLERKEPLEKWMKAQETGSSAPLDVLREVQELKKINQSLMKPGPIDDLIGDAYAFLFNTVGKQLWDEARRIKQEEEASRPPPVVSPPRNPMMSLTNLMNVDGTNDTPANPPSAPSSQPAANPTDGLTRRKIGVGRREIRTSAEACFQKPNVAPIVTSTKPLPRVQVIIDSSKEHVPGDVSVETSAPGSIHDSADDESELSELEEEGEGSNHSPPSKVEPRPMFPGLMSRLESREVSEGFETAEEGPIEKVDTEMEDQPGDVEQLPDEAVTSTFTAVDQ